LGAGSGGAIKEGNSDTEAIWNGFLKDRKLEKLERNRRESRLFPLQLFFAWQQAAFLLLSRWGRLRKFFAE
jgi:hypothetical protein